MKKLGAPLEFERNEKLENIGQDLTYETTKIGPEPNLTASKI